MSVENTSSDIKQELGEQVSLKVINAEGLEVFFKIKRKARIGKLLDAYCIKQGLNRNSVRFLYDGNPIDEERTPEELEMEEDDQIDAFEEQIGGDTL
mmetsp:Transcript_1734/g.2633  ORF Transcript_1734/g.2633 Transcript_1734/m.2633 type:complete len:97 (-) Transcript_1734:44-334(-)